MAKELGTFHARINEGADALEVVRVDFFTLGVVSEGAEALAVEAGDAAALAKVDGFVIQLNGDELADDSRIPGANGGYIAVGQISVVDALGQGIDEHAGGAGFKIIAGA